MKPSSLMVVMSVWASLALAQEPAKPAKDNVETPAAAEAKDATKEFKPPPGFKAKKRGKITLYCMQDPTVGTRFKTEKCYDIEQMKAYILAREQNNRDFDQRRAVCSNPAVCAPP